MKLLRALVSVSNKEGIVDFTRVLRKRKIEIISTGGTSKLLSDNNVKVTSISDYTGFPEILDGRVKTLHPKIYGGLLARRSDAKQLEQLKEFGISEIHMVVVNLYPFEQTVVQPNCTLADAIENIDIGGVSLIRAAAKNYKDVIVVTDPKDYSLILEEMDKNGGDISEETRGRLAIKAFSVTSYYDRLISNYLYGEVLGTKDSEKSFPPVFHVKLKKVQDLRYGENAHQKAAFYIDESVSEPGLAKAEILHGKELSFNNIFDLDSGLNIAKEFVEPVAVIIKHANPCGVGRHESSIAKAFKFALDSDPLSAFGGIVVLNREVDAGCAEELSKLFLEAILAPSFDKKAFAILEKKKNIRLLTLPFGENQNREKLDLKKVTGGMLVQDRDLTPISIQNWKTVSGTKIDTETQDKLIFAWKIVKHVKSNAIVIANHDQTVGIGMGQTSRVDAVKLALDKAKGKTDGAVLASDAFFPFADSMDLIQGLGLLCVIQPGGSIRDDEVIKAAQDKKIPMIFTGERHFKH